jgi:hypothetical protein
VVVLCFCVFVLCLSFLICVCVLCRFWVICLLTRHVHTQELNSSLIIVQLIITIIIITIIIIISVKNLLFKSDINPNFRIFATFLMLPVQYGLQVRYDLPPHQISHI